MTLLAAVRRSLAAGLAAAPILLGAAAAAAAECRDDLVASQDSLRTTRAGVDQAAEGPGKCPAHRKHYAAMIRFRDVLARCDTSKERAGRVVGLNASIDEFRKAMPAGCRP
jgi:hypothetical protein